MPLGIEKDVQNYAEYICPWRETQNETQNYMNFGSAVEVIQNESENYSEFSAATATNIIVDSNKQCKSKIKASAKRQLKALQHASPSQLQPSSRHYS